MLNWPGEKRKMRRNLQINIRGAGFTCTKYKKVWSTEQNDKTD